jgi:hypothetical protein
MGDTAERGSSVMDVDVCFSAIASAAYVTSLIILAYEYATAPTREK